MFENSGLRSKDRELRKVAILSVILLPLIIAATLLMLAAFPFHYVPHSVFWPAAFGEALLLNLLNRRFLLLRANRKIEELETDLLRVKASLKNSVLCRNLTEPAISAGLAFPAKLGTVAVVAVEMWEPAFGAGFQAPWDGQQSFGKDFAMGPTERHFHSEPGILPILVQTSPFSAA